MSTPCPHVPRDAWTRHPHWPEQVLLLGSHANFREISAYLVAACEALLAQQSGTPLELGEDVQLPSLATIASIYRRWIAGMRSHESYEEYKLYPYLSRRWELSFEEAEAGHEQLHTRHDEVLAALAEAREGGLVTTRLHAALRAHDEALVAHLALEEELVVPALLSLEPREFHRYTMLSISSLMAELDEASPRV